MTPESATRLEIARRVAEVYKRVPGIDSLGVGGSTALGTAYAGSDVDLWATCETLPTRDEREQALRLVASAYGTDGSYQLAEQGAFPMESLRLESVEVHLVIGRNEDLVQVSENLANVGTKWEAGISEYHRAVVLHDPKGLWRALKARLDEYPTEVGRLIVQEHLDRLAVLLGDFERASAASDMVSAREAQAAALESLSRALCAVNRQYFRRLRDTTAILAGCELLPPRFAPRFKALAAARNPRSVLDQARGLARDTLPLVQAAYAGIDPGQIERAAR